MSGLLQVNHSTGLNGEHVTPTDGTTRKGATLLSIPLLRGAREFVYKTFAGQCVALSYVRPFFLLFFEAGGTLIRYCRSYG